jgi:hypothetical protein
MSYKTSLVKMALNNTPKSMVLWAANKKLKGVAKLMDYSYNSEERKLYTQMVLDGEEEPVDVFLEGFTIVVDEGLYKLVFQQARSSRSWLDVLLNKVLLSREWKIPESKIGLVQELFEVDDPESNSEP